ncbi:MAG: DUF1850 domain-containing protein [Casimicrobiaceae bacterium]
MLPEAIAIALGLCLAASSSLGVEYTHAHFLPVTRFTLAWTHSRERTRWEEDYQITSRAGHASSPLLRLIESRVKGSGAGVDPGPTARLENGWYRDRPQRAPLTELFLSRSEHAADYELCIGDTGEQADDRCRPLADFLPKSGFDEAAQSVRLRPCRLGH